MEKEIVMFTDGGSRGNPGPAAIGVYIHGLAGDNAVKEISKASLVAGDIITYLGGIRLID